MGGEPPDADGAGNGPGPAAVGGFGLECLAVMGLIVIADLDDDGPVLSLHPVEFVIGLCSSPGRDGIFASQPQLTPSSLDSQTPMRWSPYPNCFPG